MSESSEPVFRDGDKIRIHCPECRHLGTHLGTCSWSQMRSGRVWTFIAEAIDFADLDVVKSADPTERTEL